MLHEFVAQNPGTLFLLLAFSLQTFIRNRPDEHLLNRNLEYVFGHILDNFTLLVFLDVLSLAIIFAPGGYVVLVPLSLVVKYGLAEIVVWGVCVM